MTDTQQAPSLRLLLTGFEPFGGAAVNPSWELARRFEGNTIEMVHVQTAVLPVNWASAWGALQEAIERVDPQWVLMLGLAATRTAVGAEVRARNYTTPVPDNAGALPPADDRVEPAGPQFRVCTLPAPLIAERMQEAGVPAEISTDAGSYLCNWTLYKALAYADGRPSLRGVGFVHIPPLPGQGGNMALNLDRLEKALRMVIDSLVAGQAPLFDIVEAEIEAERASELAERISRQGHA